MGLLHPGIDDRGFAAALRRLPVRIVLGRAQLERGLIEAVVVQGGGWRAVGRGRRRGGRPLRLLVEVGRGLGLAGQV